MPPSYGVALHRNRLSHRQTERLADHGELIVPARSSVTSSGVGKTRPVDLSAIPIAVHEQAMRLAIAQGRGNPAFPFGAVILRAADRWVMATGVNNSSANPTFHGEIVAIDDYVARHGNRGWGEAIL